MVYTREKYIPNQILCPHCHAMNPVHERICQKCRKIVHIQQKVPIWKHKFGANRLMILIGILVCQVCLIGIHRMIKVVESHVDNIHSQTARYQDSVIDTHKTRSKFKKEQSEALSSDDFNF